MPVSDIVVGPLAAATPPAPAGIAAVAGAEEVAACAATGLELAGLSAVEARAVGLRALGFFASGVISSSFLMAASSDNFSAFCKCAMNLSPILVLRIIVSMTILAFWSAFWR